MARYIDEKDVYKLVEPTGIARVHCSQIDELPRADVVPKSEVERLQAELDDKQFRCDSCDRIGLTHSEHIFCIKQAKTEVAREIFAEIDKILKTQERYLYCNPSLAYVYELIEELKKKYKEKEENGFNDERPNRRNV